MTDEETLARLLCRLHFDRREWRGACPKAERTAWLVEKYWPQWRSDAAIVIRATSDDRPAKFTGVYDRVVRRFWATDEPISEREFRMMVEAEGLRYPAALGRVERPPSPNEILREALK